MSSFPLNPKKTTSGIVVDPRTLERVVPTTRRSDGSARKELRIRPGFTPEEDVAKYRSTGKREAERLKGYVPGATSASSATYVSDFPSLGGPSSTMTKSQKKNAARSSKRAEANAAAGGGAGNEWWSDDEQQQESQASADKQQQQPVEEDSDAANAMSKLSVKDTRPETNKPAANGAQAPAPPKKTTLPATTKPTPTPPPPRKELRPPRPGGGIAGLQAIVSANAAANAQRKR